KNGSLSGMGLLISLVSNVPREAIKKMAFTDYKVCEVYMMSFLAYSPQPESGVTS
ncbi:phage tail assembly protein, partial [Yersinia enterocolitica]